MNGPVMVDRGGFRLAARISGAGQGAPWIVLSPGAAHLPNVDNSFAFQAAVAPFLGLS
jgi:hypothetical protein